MRGKVCASEGKHELLSYHGNVDNDDDDDDDGNGGEMSGNDVKKPKAEI